MASGDAPEVKQTDAERTQALHARNRWNERIDDGYLALEQNAVRDANTDYTNLLQGQASAEVALAERDAYKNIASRPTATAANEVATTINNANTMARNDAVTGGLKIKDSAMINALKRGNDVAADSSQLLSSAAGLAGRRAVESVQNKVMLDNVKMQSYAQLLGSAVQGYSMGQAGYGIDKTGVVDKKGNSKGWTPLLAGLR